MSLQQPEHTPGRAAAPSTPGDAALGGDPTTDPKQEPARVPPGTQRLQFPAGPRSFWPPCSPRAAKQGSGRDRGRWGHPHAADHTAQGLQNLLGMCRRVSGSTAPSAPSTASSGSSCPHQPISTTNPVLPSAADSIPAWENDRKVRRAPWVPTGLCVLREKEAQFPFFLEKGINAFVLWC